eukprot:g1689.t1
MAKSSSWRQLLALLKKNYRTKRRFVTGILLEIGIPVGLVAVLVLLYGLIEVTTVPQFTHTAEIGSVMEFTLLPKILEHDGQFIGIYPDNAVNRDFFSIMNDTYPGFKPSATKLGTEVTKCYNPHGRDSANVTLKRRLNALKVPDFASISRFFSDIDDFNQYIRDPNYATGNKKFPSLYGALQLDKVTVEDANKSPENAFVYSVRLNATDFIDTHFKFNTFSRDQIAVWQQNYTGYYRGKHGCNTTKILHALRGGSSGFPHSSDKGTEGGGNVNNPLLTGGLTPIEAEKLRGLCYKPGFLTLQRLVDRYLINQTRTSEAQAIEDYLKKRRRRGAIQERIDLDALIDRLKTGGHQHGPRSNLVESPLRSYHSSSGDQVDAFLSMLSSPSPSSTLFRDILDMEQFFHAYFLDSPTWTGKAMRIFQFEGSFAAIESILNCTFHQYGPLKLLEVIEDLEEHTDRFLRGTLYAPQRVAFMPFPSAGYELNLFFTLFVGCLSPTVAFGLAVGILAEYEGAGQGVTYSTFNFIDSKSGVAFGWMIYMLIFDTFLLYILSWYLEKVWFRDYGVPLPFYFPFLPSYWGFTKDSTNTPNLTDQSLTNSIMENGNNIEEPLLFHSQTASASSRSSSYEVVQEPYTADQAQALNQGSCIRIRELYKTFKTPDGKKIAVNRLNLTMFDSEIYVLLGHNGAGKTTTMSMLTGILPVEDGHAHIFDQLDAASGPEDLRQIRQMIGYCPQQNVLFDQLTVKEHLQLFSVLKGVPDDSIEDHIADKIRDVGLNAKVNALPPNLSGGQKRKLCLAIALVGDSRIVMLDEPTSGMDVYAQRFTWNLLRKAAKGRIIVLTTHSMEEADMLGDRIGIMSNGRCVCEGSPIFLKSRYGVGYSLVITRAIEGKNNKKANGTVAGTQEKEEKGKSKDGFDNSDNDETSPLLTLVRKFVPTAKLLSDIGAEISLQLPLSSSAVFENMLQELDGIGKEKYGVLSYGISVTTIEEVFLKSAAESDRKLAHRHSIDQSTHQPSSSAQQEEGQDTDGGAKLDLVSNDAAWSSDDDQINTYHKNDVDILGMNLFMVHFGALFLKRFRYTVRDFKAICCVLVLPLIMLCFSLYLIEEFASDPVPLHFNQDILDHYNHILNNPYSPEKEHQSPLPYFIPYTNSSKNKTKDENEDVCFSNSDDWLSHWKPQRIANHNITLPSKDDHSWCKNEYLYYHGNPDTIQNNTSPSGNGMSGGSTTTDAVIYYFLCEVANNRSHSSNANASKNANLTSTLASLLLESSKYYAVQEWLITSANLKRQESVYAAANQNLMYSNKSASPPMLVADVAFHQNTSSVHGVPALLSSFNQALLRMQVQIDQDKNKQQEENAPPKLPSIALTNDPFPLTARQKDQRSAGGGAVGSIMIAIAFSFVPASIATFVVRERGTDVKYQQLISGVSISAYWMSTFLWDLVMYSFTLLGVYIILHAFDIKTFVESETIASVMLLFTLYGTSTATSTYVLSFAFRDPSSARNFFLTFYIITVILMIASNIMDNVDSTCEVNEHLTGLYLIFPSFALADGLFRISLIGILPFLDIKCKYDNYQNYPGWDRKKAIANLPHYSEWDAVGRHLWYMGLETVIFLGLTLLVDYLLCYPKFFRFCCGLCSGETYLRNLENKDCGNYDPSIDGALGEQDLDVQKEFEMVTSALNSTDYHNVGNQDDGVAAAELGQLATSDGAGQNAITLHNLRKIYYSRDAKTGKRSYHAAVKDLTFGIRLGECFGFLGVNGAGKSTTLKILSGDLIPTGGTARLLGWDILEDQMKVRRLLGYCPQTNCILDLLTVREHLELFARIKGTSLQNLDRVVRSKMEAMDLVEFEHKKAGSLSGGNKRKLCVAIALIGGPRLIFLDEPSAGMDPAAKRFMWNLISRITRVADTTVILTTHSMEEASALCSRIGIMVDGRLRCLGSEQHLKDRHGRGYQLQFKLADADTAYLRTLVSSVTGQDQQQQKHKVNNGEDKNISIDDFAQAAPPIRSLEELRGVLVSMGKVSQTSSLELKKRINLFTPGDVQVSETTGSQDEEDDGSTWLIKTALESNDVDNGDRGEVSLTQVALWWANQDLALELKSFLHSEFLGFRIVENHGAVYRVVVPETTSRGLPAIFGILEKAKQSQRIKIAEYSVSQTSLDQIFVQFAKKQVDMVKTKGMM